MGRGRSRVGVWVWWRLGGGVCREIVGKFPKISRFPGNFSKILRIFSGISGNRVGWSGELT